MKNITMQQCADYLEEATIEKTFDMGAEILHMGVNATGSRFILLNDWLGNTILGEFQQIGG